MKNEIRHALILLAGVALCAFFFANVEIQIEGANGWAANLPTWRVEHHLLLDIFWGGRPMTGYHAWVFSFMLLMFHLPLLVTWKWSMKLEARIIGCSMLFWIIEDFLWFILNPAFGVSKLDPAHVPWHKFWFYGIPTDYVTFTLVGLALLVWSFLPARQKE